MMMRVKCKVHSYVQDLEQLVLGHILIQVTDIERSVGKGGRHVFLGFLVF